MATTRRPRWHPPPPPSPRILHLPRRPRRKTAKPAAGKPGPGRELECRAKQRGKLESLFDQERAFARSVPPVVLINSGIREQASEEQRLVEDEEEHWRFQAEILRAECRFLRFEREIAKKKLELNRFRTKTTLKSAVQTLNSGRSKIGEGEVLEEEIRVLEENLSELQRCCSSGIRDFEVRMCDGSSNFDRQACVLQRRLERLGRTICEEKCVKDIREIAAASLSISDGDDDQCKDVEILRRKMERLSKGMLERMEEEYGSMLVSSSSSSLSSASASADSSAASSMRLELHHPSLTSAIVPQIHHQEAMRCDEDDNNNNKGCTGRCKSIVRKIVEQVRAETEEWSQMQQMLERVKEEMEELQTFLDFWKNKALDSDERIQSLKSNVKEWKKRARSSEAKATELGKQISGLHIELEKLKTQNKAESPITQTATGTATATTTKECSLKEKEKRVLICSLKENHQSSKGINNGDAVGIETKKLPDSSKEGGHHVRQRVSSSKSRRALPLREIGNFPQPLPNKSNSGALFPLHYSEVSHGSGRSVGRGE